MNSKSLHITREIASLKAAADGAEYRLRRNNLPFYGIPDALSETWTLLQKNVLSLSSELLGITLEKWKVERAQRIGHFQASKNRPIVVKFNHFKVTPSIIASGNKLKNSDFALCEDVSGTVRVARKKLLEFAKESKCP